MSRTFLILNNVLGIQRPNGRVVVQGRMISGAAEMQKYWTGQRTIVAVEPVPEVELERNKDRTLGGDNVEVGPNDLPFELRVLPFDSPEMYQLLSTVTVGLGGLNWRQTHVSRWARKLGIPWVYGTEYTFRTYLQILFAEHSDPFKRLRSGIWHSIVEAKQIAAILRSDGLQCNGVPTYRAYRRLCRNTILFFDGRTSEEMLVKPDVLEPRLEHLQRGEKLRLGFSGRLNKIKGADELIEVARRLKHRGLNFSLKIWGGGVLAETMRQDIVRYDLQDCTEVCGFTPFEELTKTMQREIDIWLCCHPQGDPSGAYMESYANGLPILGYANEALEGLLAIKACGRAVPIRDRDALADLVIRTEKDRALIARWSREGVAFAAEHTFDKTFRRRMEHIEGVIERVKSRGRAPEARAT